MKFDCICVLAVVVVCFCTDHAAAQIPDDCSQKLNLNDGDTPFSNVGVDPAPNGPDPCGIMGSDIWFNYTSPFNGLVHIDLCDNTTPGFDTILAVYEGCDCPPQLTDLIVCNDDDDIGFCGAPTLKSVVEFQAIAGNCYKIQIGGYKGDQGEGVIHVVPPPPPPPCLGDTDFDGDVDVDDLGNVFVNWGNPGGLGDTDGDGDVDVDDLGNVFVNWGLCPYGACCLPDGSCLEDAFEVDCNDAGGVYQGDQSNCFEVVCEVDPGFIPAGQDCAFTSCGRTKFSYCETPLPPDFFNPGSDPFFGTVHLQGQDPGVPDTIIQRLDDVVLSEPWNQATVDIEIVSMSLKSCQPIIVTFNGGQNPEFWNVQIDLSSTPQPQGQMIIDKLHPNGGVLSADLPVLPLFTFTKVGDPSQVRVIDTGAKKFPPFLFSTLDQVPWVHFSTGGVPAPCGENFIPGVEDTTGGPTAGLGPSQCCRPICLSARRADICALADPGCPLCPAGACCLPNGSCVIATDQSECEKNLGGQYFGDGTTCFDTDSDGISDVQESNDCCAGADQCNTGTVPIDPDTDGDGTNDGSDPAPCDSK